jgi:radical SAM protein with 4Fe4S-binding SPASM domain
MTAGMPAHLLHFSKDKKPVVVWNTTQRCNLHCIHCYASAQDREFEGELTTEEGLTLLDDLAAFGAPTVLFSGGEPLIRPDIFELAAHASSRGLRAVLSTNGTLIDDAMAQRIEDAGFSYVGISFDGIGAAHDKIRGQKGAFDASLAGLKRCRDRGIRTGLRYTIHAKNIDQLPAVFDMLETENIPRACFYHLAYAGRGERLQKFDLTPDQTRWAVNYVFDRAEDFQARGVEKEILTVDNHADNVLLYLRVKEREPERAAEILRMLEWNGGNQSGIAIGCVDPTGNVHVDQFSWGYSLGNVRERPFSEIWDDTSDERLAILRDRKARLKGRCPCCQFFDICNGNLRARAESYFGEFTAPDPACYFTDEEIGIEPGTPEAAAAAEWLVPVQAVEVAR